MTLPPMPPRPDSQLCRWHGQNAVPRIAFPAGVIGTAVNLPNGLMICSYCDMSNNGAAGPPVMLDYLKRGHQ